MFCYLLTPPETLLEVGEAAAAVATATAATALSVDVETAGRILHPARQGHAPGGTLEADIVPS